jgi:hypothetical protein
MAADVTPEEVIETLHDAGIMCVLMGTHALNTWRSEPRATQGVDILVRKKDIQRATQALHARYSELTVTDTTVVTRFADPAAGKVVMALMKPTQTVYQVVFRHTVQVSDTHQIPDLEMALASKFAAMVSPNRDPDKKMIDGGDFINVVRSNRVHIDVRKLQRLAERVYPNWYRDPAHSPGH